MHCTLRYFEQSLRVPQHVVVAMYSTTGVVWWKTKPQRAISFQFWYGAWTSMDIDLAKFHIYFSVSTRRKSTENTLIFKVGYVFPRLFSVVLFSVAFLCIWSDLTVWWEIGDWRVPFVFTNPCLVFDLQEMLISTLSCSTTSPVLRKWYKNLYMSSECCCISKKVLSVNISRTTSVTSGWAYPSSSRKETVNGCMPHCILIWLEFFLLVAIFPSK